MVKGVRQMSPAHKKQNPSMLDTDGRLILFAACAVLDARLTRA
jgi:hypothetical protein